MTDLTGKTALVTGASRGIGAAAAREFAAAGYDVIINYNKSEAAAESLLGEIRAKGQSASAVKADVSARAEVLHMFGQTGGVDVLINNAGIAQQKLFTDITEQEWDRIFNVNMKGMFNCAQAYLPYMINQKHGEIINVSSVWGISGASCEVHYSASKAAVIGFTKALAKETGPSGIRVNCVAPGVIDTDMNARLSEQARAALREETPLGVIGKPEDISALMLFLASDKADFITGQVIGVDGGFLV